MRLIDPIELKRSIAVAVENRRATTLDEIIDEQPTIELRCEECEAFNKTRLLVPQPERKMGKWIDKSIPWGYACSSCGKWFVIGTEAMKEYNYCPNCGSYNGVVGVGNGADMRGEEE